MVGPSVIRADWTDLLTVPALGVAGWAYLRVRDRPVSHRTVRRLGVLLVLPTAVLGVAATSQGQGSPRAVAVGVWDGAVVLGWDDYSRLTAEHPPAWWLVGRGDTPTWRPITEAQRQRLDADLPELAIWATEACVPQDPDRCYRLVPGRLRVEQSVDAGATWQLSWEVPENQRGYLVRSYRDIEDPQQELVSRAVAVLARPGGHLVVVANGADGFAVRGLDGDWRRLERNSYATSGAHAAPAIRPDTGLLLPEVAASLIVGVLVLAAAGWSAAFWRACVIVGAAAALFAVPGLLIDYVVVLLLMAVFGTGLVVTFAGMLGLLVALDRVGGLPGWRPLWLVVGAVLVPAAMIVTFVGWSHGVVDYRTAVLISLACAVVGVIVAGRQGACWAESALRSAGQPGSRPAPRPGVD